MKIYKLRKAKIEDSTSILRLIKELAEFENESNSVKLKVEDIKQDGFGFEPKFSCFVVEASDIIVGIALYYPRYSTWEGPTLHLEDLIVSQNYRGKGIGKQLYSSFIKEAISLGMNRAEWAVLNWNEKAIKFYKNTGANILNDWRTVQMSKKQMLKFIKTI